MGDVHTDVSPVDEAKEVHERDSRHDVPIDLSTQSAFRFRVKVKSRGMAEMILATIADYLRIRTDLSLKKTR